MHYITYYNFMVQGCWPVGGFTLLLSTAAYFEYLQLFTISGGHHLHSELEDIPCCGDWDPFTTACIYVHNKKV
jgi:hypothetical protein